MRDVDRKMEECPLKHDIRRNMWLDFATKAVGAGPINRYLTLYSPPMMDIKLFEATGLIKNDGEKLLGVVAVTNDDEAYSEIAGAASFRPEFVINGDVNLFLQGRPAKAGERPRLLYAYAPFDIVNLDYTNSLFSPNRAVLTDHLKAIQDLFELQSFKKIPRFALFLTSYYQPQAILEEYGDLLEARISENIAGFKPFRDSFGEVFSGNGVKELRAQNYDDFFGVGLVKLITKVASQRQFKLLDSSVTYLHRDSGKVKFKMAHFAYLFERQRAPRKGLSEFGSNVFYEENVLGFLEKRRAVPFPELSVTADHARLWTTHSAEIKALGAKTFELPIPEPAHAYVEAAAAPLPPLSEV